MAGRGAEPGDRRSNPSTSLVPYDRRAALAVIRDEPAPIARLRSICGASRPLPSPEARVGDGRPADPAP